MPSNHLNICHPLLPLPSMFSSIRVFSNESALHIRWPKYWNFSFSISPFNEYSGLISFRIDCFDLLAVQGTLKSLLQHHTSKASILQHSAFLMVQLTSVHDSWTLMLKRNGDNSVVLEVAPKYYILDSSVEYEGYSISSRIFLPTVIDICSSALNLLIPVNFSSLILKVSTILHLLLDHIQFTLIHGPNIPGSYAILDRKIAIFTASDFTLATRYVSSCT